MCMCMDVPVKHAGQTHPTVLVSGSGTEVKRTELIPKQRDCHRPRT